MNPSLTIITDREGFEQITRIRQMRLRKVGSGKFVAQVEIRVGQATYEFITRTLRTLRRPIGALRGKLRRMWTHTFVLFFLESHGLFCILAASLPSGLAGRLRQVITIRIMMLAAYDALMSAAG